MKWTNEEAGEILKIIRKFKNGQLLKLIVVLLLHTTTAAKLVPVLTEIKEGRI